MAIELDARLSMLAALTPACRMVADIGADHGFLGAALLQSGRCEQVQFIDVSEPSLRKAWRLVRREGLMDRALFSVGDGFSALLEPVDAAIIAGMGGPTIAGIVERGLGRLHDARLILQPNVGICELRARLMAAGLRIVDEELTRAGGRWYVAIATELGDAPMTEQEQLAGPVLMLRRHPLLKDYAGFRMRVLTKAMEGARQGDSERAGELRCEIERWEEIVTWLSR